MQISPSSCFQRYWCISATMPKLSSRTFANGSTHDDVIKWKRFPSNWPIVRVNSPHKGQWRGALMFSLICVWINDWISNHEAGDLRSYRAHYDVIVMILRLCSGQVSHTASTRWTKSHRWLLMYGIRCMEPYSLNTSWVDHMNDDHRI